MSHKEYLYLLQVSAALKRWFVQRSPHTVRVRVGKELRAEFCAGMAPHADRAGVEMQLVPQGVMFTQCSRGPDT